MSPKSYKSRQKKATQTSSKGRILPPNPVAPTAPSTNAGGSNTTGHRYNLRERKIKTANVTLEHPSTTLLPARRRKPAKISQSAPSPDSPLQDLTNARAVYKSPTYSGHIDSVQPQSSPPYNTGNPLPSSLSHSTDGVNLAAWLRSYGYEDSADDEMTSIASCSLAPSETPSRQQDTNKKPKPIDARQTAFYLGLLDRNVDFKPTSDTRRNWIDKKLSLEKSPVESTPQQEENWQTDLRKSRDSEEAIFQRTAMMDLIDRHRLDDCLDYTCESTWTCTRMPRKKKAGAAELAQPKPDLAVAFKTYSLVSQKDLRSLANLKGYICPEASREGKDTRAFHFFSMEAKGVEANNATMVAFRQNFNTASQALHNMYELMRRAGQESVFFSHVRFFSATATAKMFQIRVHRAEKLEKPRHFIEAGYPLSFAFAELVTISESEYTRSKVLEIVRGILVGYGVKTLQPILKNALAIILENIDNDLSANSQTSKRPAEELMESFDSSRRRFSTIEMSDQDSQPRQVQITAGG